MTQEQPSNSSLSFVLVKVNRRSKSVLAEARKQAISKQEQIFKSFLQNQQISNTTNNQNNSSRDFQQQYKLSPPKNITPHQVSHNKQRELLHIVQKQQNQQLLKDLNGVQNESTKSKGLNRLYNQLQHLDYYEDDTFQSTQKNASKAIQIDNSMEEDDYKKNLHQIYIENSYIHSPQQVQNQQNNNLIFEEQNHLPMFLQTYMKPCKQKSLSFYKQNLQHKKQISQKMNNTRFLQIWNEEDDYQVKIQHNPPHVTHYNYKNEPSSKKIQVYNELPVFFPKSKQLRKSFCKITANAPLQKQFMGEDIQVQNSQQVYHNQNGLLQNSHTSSKEMIELNTLQCLNEKQQQASHFISLPQNQQQQIPDSIQKTSLCRDKRSSSVKETQSTVRKRININSGVPSHQFGENQALQKILDIYSKPNNQNNLNKKRFSHLERQTFMNVKDNQSNNPQWNFSLTPARHHQSNSQGQKNTMLTQNKLQLDNFPAPNDNNSKILFQRQQYFKTLFNKMQKAQNGQKDQISITPQNNSITNQPSCQQTIQNIYQSTSATTKQTVELVEDNQLVIPYRIQEQNNFFRTSKLKLFEVNQQDRLTKFINFESQKSSPSRKKPQKVNKKNVFERGFTLKDNEISENVTDYNLSNYVTDQRHIL